MRQAIRTHYLGPTNTKGARIKASCQARSITLDWNHSSSAYENHRVAASVLFKQLEWDERGSFTLAGGFGDKNDCYFVIIPRKAVA